MSADTVWFDAFGYVVLREAFDPEPLSGELDVALRDGTRDPNRLIAGAVGNRFRYVPMMCERTPVSLELVAALAPVVERLLGGPVLPGRAKGTEYLGAAGWHRDSSRPLRSVGVLCYLEPLDEASGALRVLPGSHHEQFGDALERVVARGDDPPGVAVPTAPGDVLIVDERLFHSSRGRAGRRQWRVDYVSDTAVDDDLREYFAAAFVPGWDGGYDADRYPSFGPSFRRLDARWDERLTAVGAYGAAQAEEDAVRRHR